MSFQYDDENTVPHPASQNTQPSVPVTQPVYVPNPYLPPTPPPIPSPYSIPPAPRRRPRRGLSRGCLGCLALLVILFGASACACSATTIVAVAAWRNQLSTTIAEKQKTLAQQTFQTAKIYDRNGNLLHELFDQGRRTNIKMKDMPKVMIDATIATEDKSFYDNSGVDISAIVRSVLQLFISQDQGGGGSTITQQLIRNIIFDYQYRTQRSAQRKIEEIGMALVLTGQMSKDDILELYLNQIYYGNLAYGIEAAAQTYFGKPAAQLTLAEASLLAGLPQLPGELDPLNPDPAIQARVKDRQRVVLDAMVATGKIARPDADAAFNQPLTFVTPTVNLVDPHFTVYAEAELKELLTGLNLPPETLLTGGLSVYTTVDQRFQTLAERSAQEQIAQIATKNNAHNAAIVVLKPSTGEILAMVGSVNYNDLAIQGKVNVTTSQQQPGSAIKPLTYAAAMEKGMTAASILWDTEQHIGTPGAEYVPRNYDGRFHGVVRVRDALANSYNIPAVQTLRRIGVESLMNIAQRFGIQSFGNDASHYGLSLTLGGGELTPLELTQAYAVFANGGVFVPTTSVLCIVNGEGSIIYQYENTCPRGTQTPSTINASAPGRQVLDPRISFIISDILADNNARSPAMGARSPLFTPNIPTSVKTGTTNDYRDNWTLGYTRNAVVGVWVGNTDNSKMVNSTGLTGAAPIWNAVMNGIYNDPALKETLMRNGALLTDGQPQPEGLIRKQICNLASIKDPATTCAPGRVEWFVNGPAYAPDSTGKLVPGQYVPPTPPPNNGPRWADIEPDIVQMVVQPLDPNVSAALVPVASTGRAAAPPPRYCAVPYEIVGQLPSAQPQVFIKPPLFGDEDVYARIYAQSAGIPILPNVACTPELLAASANPGAAGVTASILSPAPGQTVTGTVQVVGIAGFTAQQATYYKVEILGPQFPDWTTIGETHANQVVNGELEHFGATGLQPGIYQLRLVIVGLDGNYLTTTPGVPIQITGQ